MEESSTTKRLRYFVYVLIFLFGGTEYAVILPTLWLYLHNTYEAPEYMLGLVLSIYSVATFLSAPVFGRLGDCYRCPKQIFIVCICFQLVGSFLYFIGISQWLCLASRFISGLGGAAEALVLAEVARHTTEKERTGAFSKLVSMRMIALLAGPGLNVFLRLADFNIGPFEVNKYTAPGAFMTIMWFLLLLLVLLLYKNPTEDTVECDTLVDDERKRLLSNSNTTQEERLNYDNPSMSHRTNPSPIPSPQTYAGMNDKWDITKDDEGVKLARPVELPNFLGSSFDIMASAEFYMRSPDSGYQNIAFDDDNDDDDEAHLQIDMNHFAAPPPTYHCPSIQDGKDKRANEDYITVTTSALNDHLQREGKLNFFCNEYIRDEIMAVFMLTFCATFSQVCLETMFTPLSLTYMDFGELENSILYCVCGLVIIITFIMVSVISKCVSDRNMILFGGSLLLAANIWLIVFLPHSPKHNCSANLPYFGMAVTIDILSLPFLFICAASLYSKLTRKETQGLSQGLRRAIAGLGTILGPLWASSAVKQLYVLFGVMIVIQSISMLLCLLSYKRLKVPSSRASSQNEIIPQAEVKSESPEDSVVNSQSYASHDPILESSSPSYGTIQRDEPRV